MNLEEKYEEKLKRAYRNVLFETEDIDISKLQDLITDDNLKAMFQLNNFEMCKLKREKEIDKVAIRKLFIANVNLYKIAKSRQLEIHGSSCLFDIASIINYDLDKLYSELNVGAYYRPHRPR